jgi:hypothetical protein
VDPDIAPALGEETLPVELDIAPEYPLEVCDIPA